MSKSKINFNPKNFIIELTKQQVQPALGCTEIGIVSLATAKAAKLLPGKLASALVKVSTCIYRNDVRVGVPKLGICGIPTIAAAGFVLKNPEKKLGCIADANAKDLIEIRKLGASKKIIVNIDYNAQPVFTYVKAKDLKNNVATVLIEGAHDNIVSAKLNGKETIKISSKHSTVASCGVNFDDHVDDIPLEKIYQLCKSMLMVDLKFLIPGIKMNEEICKYGLKHYKNGWITKSFIQMKQIKNKSRGLFNNDSTLYSVLLNVCSAVEARMYGCDYPVMTSANSGDHGLTVSLTLITYAKIKKIPMLKLLQGLLFAHYLTWYIKSHVGHLCGMCGCTIAAAPGAICGIAFLNNWSWKQINNLLNAHLCSQSNILCDGAKPSCAYKCINAILNGYLAFQMVKNNGYILSKDGIVYHNVEETIKNYQYISSRTLKNIVNATVQMLDHIQKGLK